MSDDDILALVQGFEECTWPHARWSHHAHLTVALYYLRKLPREAATHRIRSGIQRYNRTIPGGDPNGYHETVTLAWIEIIVQFLQRHDQGQPLADLTRHLVEECGSSQFLSRYYSKRVLVSHTARQNWVPPDVQPFPTPPA